MHSDIHKDSRNELLESNKLEVLNPSKIPPIFNQKGPKKIRNKSPIRSHFDEEVDLIRKQIGTIEEVRIKLDLTARKMCQLLMVDPSAWNRWTTGITNPPPHIYRSLQWYMMLNDKLPGVDPRFFLPKKSFFRSAGLQNNRGAPPDKIENINKEEIAMTQYYQLQARSFELEIKSLKSELDTFKRLLIISSVFIGILVLGGFIKLFF